MPARHVEAEETVEERDARRPRRSSADRPGSSSCGRQPSRVGEHRRSHAGVVRSELGARQPERIAALRRIGTLAAHGLRSAEVPETLRRQPADRASAGQRQRAGQASESMRHREVERAASVQRIARRRLEPQIGEHAQAARIETVVVRSARAPTPAYVPRRATRFAGKSAPFTAKFVFTAADALLLDERAPLDARSAAERRLATTAELDARRAIVESFVASEHQRRERAAEAERTSPIARRHEMVVAAERRSVRVRFVRVTRELEIRLPVRETNRPTPSALYPPPSCCSTDAPNDSPSTRL